MDYGLHGIETKSMEVYGNDGVKRTVYHIPTTGEQDSRLPELIQLVAKQNGLTVIKTQPTIAVSTLPWSPSLVDDPL
jgi:hypothetical protein